MICWYLFSNVISFGCIRELFNCFELNLNSCVGNCNKQNEIVSMFHGDMESILCFACTDDYPWWNEHSNLPSAGKPLWLTLNEEECLPIFFDDNIHNDADDSIVAVRVRETKEQNFTPLSGEETIKMQGQHLVRVPTFAPVLNENWFLEQIDACEKIFLEKREEGK